MADPLCADSIKTAGSVPVVGGIYVQFVRCALAGILLYPAGSISSRQDKETAYAYMLYDHRSLYIDDCFLDGNTIG